jgi:dephospho-CoA kinase
MLRVGLTGGYATGKSFVAAELEKHGCHLIYADKIGHEVLYPSGEAYAPTVALFGTGILSPDQSIDRKKLAALVFNDAELLKQLTALIHPAVFRAEEALMKTAEETDPNGIAVVEAAILIETGRYRDYDRLIVTTCSPETQIARGMKRDGLSREQVMQRIARQMSMEEKRAFADYVVDTDGRKENTSDQVKHVYLSLVRLAEKQG